MLTLVEAKKATASQPFRVMLVNNQEIFRQRLQNLLDDIDGFIVVAKANSCSGILKWAAAMPINLVLMDATLADALIMEVMPYLRKLAHPPQIVIFSATMDDEMLLNAILAGASGYLTRDLPAKEIIDVLEGLHRGEMPLLPLAVATLVHRLVNRCNDLEAALRTHLRYNRPADGLPAISSTSSSETSPDNCSHAAVDKLTPQEYKVLQLMRRGLRNKQIAARLSISPYTVGKHVQQVLRKLGVVNRTQAAAYALFEGKAMDEL